MFILEAVVVDVLIGGRLRYLGTWLVLFWVRLPLLARQVLSYQQELTKAGQNGWQSFPHAMLYVKSMPNENVPRRLQVSW